MWSEEIVAFIVVIASIIAFTAIIAVRCRMLSGTVSSLRLTALTTVSRASP